MGRNKYWKVWGIQTDIQERLKQIFHFLIKLLFINFVNEPKAVSTKMGF